MIEGPIQTNNSGLVFYYDTNNSKSYTGKPTTNYLDNPTQTFNAGEFNQYYDLRPIFETYGLVPYSLSFEMRATIPGGVFWYMQNGSWSKYGFVGNSINATSQWARYKIENVTPVGPDASWAANTPNDNRAMLATYTGYGSGVLPQVRNMQLELGPIATPFVVGTRSNTQGLLDLAGTNTISLANAAYDSNGALYFNGTGFCTTTAAVLPSANSTPITLIAWCKPTNLTGWQTVLGTHGSFRQIGFLNTNFYFGGNAGGGNNFVSGGTVSNNNWYMLAMVYDGATTGYGYLNGALASSGNIGTNGGDRKSTRLNSSHVSESRMPSSA